MITAGFPITVYLEKTAQLCDSNPKTLNLVRLELLKWLQTQVSFM